MFEHRSVTNLVKLVQLPLKVNEILAGLAVKIDHAFLELLKSINHLEEVALIQEVVIIAGLSLLSNHLGRNNQSILAEVLGQRVTRVFEQ